VKLLLELGPRNLPRFEQIAIDGRVLVFTCLISLASGILFGLAPALQSGRSDLNKSLKEGGRSAAEGQGRSRARSVLVVAEIALSLVLLVGGGLMLKSFLRLQAVNPGVNPHNVLTMQITLPERQYRDDSQVLSFYENLLDKVQTLSGVESAGVGMSLPPNLLEVTDYFTVEGQAAISERMLGLADLVFASPDYFRALGVPLVKGRYFTSTDRADTTKVAIVNQTLAHRYWPNENPVGKRLRTGGPERPHNPWMEVVGVVGDIKYSGLDAPPEMVLYEPYQQATWSSMYLAVRTSSELDNPATLASAVQNAVWSLDKDLPVAHVRTMEQLLSESVEQPRFRTVLLEIFALVALSLATVGIYGVLAYSVSQRRNEIGIRMALGAKHSDVLWLVVGQGMLLTFIGVAIGITGALVLTRFLSTLLYEVRPTDPATFVVVALLLAFVALLACCIPARRAMRVDPMTALRYE
jgi:putative ABC transport system permease protein